MIAGKEEFIRENINQKFKEMKPIEENKIVDVIKNEGYYLEIGDYIVFRLFNAVSEREEVFIGNVLFNDYISKLLLRTYRETDRYSGQIELIFNDLENYYYIVKQESLDDFSLEKVEQDFLENFAVNLEELFFGEENLEKGIYGDFTNLMLGQGSNYISLPLTILPCFFEKMFREKFIDNLGYFSNQEQISMLALYFASTGAEMQSYDKFFAKELVNPDIKIDGLINIFSDEEKEKINTVRKINLKLSQETILKEYIIDLDLIYVKASGNIEKVEKNKIKNNYLKNKLDGLPTNISNSIIDNIVKANNLLKANRLIEFVEIAYSLTKKMKAQKYNIIRYELEKYLKKLEDEIPNLNNISPIDKIEEVDEYNFEEFSYFREQIVRIKKITYQKEKLLNMQKEQYINKVFSSIFILPKERKKEEIDSDKCYICFENKVAVISKNLLTGGKEEKFTNDESNTKKNLCLKCSIYIWLKLKYLGTYYSRNVFPEKRNLVFFYGKIPEDRIKKIQGILNSLYYCTQKPSIYTYEMINESIGELEKQNVAKKSSANSLLNELIESDNKNQDKHPTKVPPTIWSWYESEQQNDNVNTHIFSLGQGENKLYTFVLPYALNRSDEVQKKFSQNKVVVYSMLSFLSRLTGVKGAFYYLSTPKLTDSVFEESVYYYKDKEREGSLKEYELLTEVAWDLVNQQNISGRTYKDRQNNAFKRRLKLAKELESLPLITIGKIYRELLSDDRYANYNNISNIWNQNLSSPNLFPLIKVSKKIRKEVDFMGQKIDTKELKVFTDKLFSELVLIRGVFPKSFRKAPTEFEKYPRLLIKKILKYDNEEGGKDVQAGFREWSTKILHSAKGFYDKDKKKIVKKIENIQKSVIEHQEVLSRKSNLLYLKRSLFGWITEYLYPLYDLVENIDDCIDEYSEETIEKTKENDKIEKLKEKFVDMEYDFDTNFDIARELLITNQNYYSADDKSKEKKEEE